MSFQRHAEKNGIEGGIQTAPHLTASLLGFLQSEQQVGGTTLYDDFCTELVPQTIKL